MQYYWGFFHDFTQANFQGRIQQVSLGGAIFCLNWELSLIKAWLYCKKDVVYFKHCYDKTDNSKMALHHQCRFPSCSKSWWIMLLSQVLEGMIAPIDRPKIRPCYFHWWASPETKTCTSIKLFKNAILVCLKLYGLIG